MITSEERQLRELDRIVRRIAPDLPYHNQRHMREVSQASAWLARREGISQDQIYLLKTAALLHDIYYVPRALDNEKKSVEVAKGLLSNLHYSSKDIVAVSRLILATKMSTTPTDLLEMILCDADLEKTGTSEFFVRSELLRQEWGIAESSWHRIQGRFLASVRYHTGSARTYLLPGLQKNLRKAKYVAGGGQYG
ncbi:MAG: HD domain-containing protein [Nanoarchaeota archaeon]